MPDEKELLGNKAASADRVADFKKSIKGKLMGDVPLDVDNSKLLAPNPEDAVQKEETQPDPSQETQAELEQEESPSEETQAEVTKSTEEVDAVDLDGKDEGSEQIEDDDTTPEEYEGEDEDDFSEYDDGEVDLDSDPESSDDEVDIDNPTEEQKTNSLKELKKVGKEKKKLERDLQLSQEEIVSRDTKIQELEQELEKSSAMQVDPLSHPDMIAKKEKTGNGIFDAVLDEVGKDAAQKIDSEWGRLLADADEYKNLPKSEKPEALAARRLSIAKILGYVSSDQTELEPGIDDDAIRESNKITKILNSYTGDYEDMAKLYSEIQTKAESKNLEIGYSEYVNTTSKVRETMAIIDTMSEKDIDEDPHSLQALAARKIQSSPEMQRKANQIDKMLLELAYGPEALSQEELDRHQQSGKDMNEFHKNRNRRVKETRENRLAELKSLYVLLPQIKKALPDIFDKEFANVKETRKKKVIGKAKGKKAPRKKEPEVSPLTKESIKDSLRNKLFG